MNMDYSDNPLEGYESVPVGNFIGTLRSVEATQSKKYQSEELEKVIKFTFDVNVGGKVMSKYITKPVKVGSDATKGLRGFVSSLDPSGAASAGTDLTRLWNVTKGCVGKQYQLNIQPTKTGTSTKIAAVMPLLVNGPTATNIDTSGMPNL